MENFKTYCDIFSPFPYLIVENTFSHDEMNLIWEELEFINQPHKVNSILNESNPNFNCKKINLKEVFKALDCSSISNLYKHFLSQDLYDQVSKLNFGYNLIALANYHDIIVNYYCDENFEKIHRDNCLFTCLTSLYKEPKKFSGGNIKFDMFNIKVELKNNSTLIFPSFVHTSINEVKMVNDIQYGNGQYYIKTLISQRL